MIVKEKIDMFSVDPRPISPQYQSPVPTAKPTIDLDLPAESSSLVKFEGMVQMHLTDHFEDLDDEEYYNTWYQRRELQLIRMSLNDTVLEVENGTYAGDNEERCARGLEYRTNAGGLRRRLHKLKALRAVLEEQERQTQEGIQDVDAIRNIYISETVESTEDAVALGMMDEEDADAVYKEGRLQEQTRPDSVASGSLVSFASESVATKSMASSKKSGSSSKSSKSKSSRKSKKSSRSKSPKRDRSTKVPAAICQ
eukprot:CAMPEP_0116836116 /NCGR_PEP_ID=MMETSP0418-20121206/7914_1 /TAXON_ID=1158023 /ORGANISM="Astrosyne radiata, Strain 13vi08-1A" /LENGTH=253 /DNA_ID=CAMNT_0004465843 /DNA_START=38 /DNA_END=799 /DNA_ORIENTATION=-